MDKPQTNTDVKPPEKAETAGGNGSSGKNEFAAPDVIDLEEVDILRILYMNEKGRRVDAEKAAYQAENSAMVAGLGRKYGIDLSVYEISIEEKKARKRPSK